MKYFYTNIEGTPMWAGIAFPSTAVEIVPVLGDPSVAETVVNFLRNYWSKDDVETFVKTYDGSFNISKLVIYLLENRCCCYSFCIYSVCWTWTICTCILETI